METMQDFLPFTREILANRAGQRMVKVYLVGAAVATLGVVLGVLETVCRPFSTEESLDEELEQLPWKGRQVRGAVETWGQSNGEEMVEALGVQSKKQPLIGAAGRRNSAARLYAS